MYGNIEENTPILRALKRPVTVMLCKKNICVYKKNVLLVLFRRCCPLVYVNTY